jgi:DNA polymerase
MDAKERLRQYLEQRREMGERELILDGMNTEEVLRLLGAANLRSGTGTAPPSASAPRPASPPESRAAAPAPEWGATSSDWREALRAAGGGPPEGPLVPRAGTARAPEAPRPPAGDDEMAARKRAAAAAVREGDAKVAAPRPDEPTDSAGMEESPAPGAATPDAVEGRPPTPRPATDAAATADAEAPAGLVVGAVGAGLFGTPFGKLESLEAIAEAARQCTRCPLYASATNAVPGEGNPDADLVCVGEAPGENEDIQGRPFVGASGQLLTKILAAIQLGRDDVFIANVLKHRPPGNRNPRPDEVEACSPYLVRQLELIRPKVILCFGTFASQTLLNTKTPIGKLRGAVHRYYGIPLIVTYHPAALLRNPAWKRPTWEDVQLARRILDRAAGA